MRPAITCSIRWATLALAVGFAGLTHAWAVDCPPSPNYSPDFTNNQSCLSLNGFNTTYTNSPSFQKPSTSTNLQLTASEGGWATSAWYITPQVVASGFSTTFSFRLGNSSNGQNADGIAFVIQNSPAGTYSGLAALGLGGCDIGFGQSITNCTEPTTGSPTSGIPNSVAIEFNTYSNGKINGIVVDTSSDNVTVQNCGGSGANSPDQSCSLRSKDLTNSITLTDGSIHVATITYTPTAAFGCSAAQGCGALDVVLDGVDLFPGGVPFNIVSLSLGAGCNANTPAACTAYAGFTAGTGGGNDNQSILSWTFSPTGQSQSGTVTPGTGGEPGPTTTFNINGGFSPGSATSGYDFTAQETDTTQNLNMVVTAIPMDQGACNALVQATFTGAKCFVYQNGAGLNKSSSVLFEVTCPPSGSCGSTDNLFDANLGTDFNFSCSDNDPLLCPPEPGIAAPSSFGFQPPGSTYPSNISTATHLPEIGFLKGEGPDPLHPCTPDTSGKPLFQSNQISTFVLGDVSGSVKGGSGGTTSCWTMTYLTGDAELPSATITQPASGANYAQGSSTDADYVCNAVDENQVTAPNNSPIGPYLTVASCTGTVASGSPFDTSTLGPHTFTVQVQDSATNTAQPAVTYYVVAAPTISAGGSSATFTVGTRGTVSITTTGYPVPTISETGALPSGVGFADNHNGTATLTGIPTTMGIYPITFTAQNGIGSAATLPFTLTVVGTVPASGTKCNGVYTGTFKGNITVTNGQSCTFVGGGVTGNITSLGGNVTLTNALVGGNVSIGGGTYSIGPSTTIKGNLTILITTTSTVPNQVCGASISGGLTFSLNATPVVIGSSSPACPGNIIGGNLTVSGNLAATSIYNNTVKGNLIDQLNLRPSQVFSNHITGNLTCSGDSSITGGSNTANKKQGQCASF